MARATKKGGAANVTPVSGSTGNAGEVHQTTAMGGLGLTTNQGIPVSDNQNSLKIGERGPVLLEDFVLREKIMHFDHERIPERIVHARGSAAHGYFEVTNPLGKVTKATFLQEKGARTPVFVRFSTVAGSKGSRDLARDVRGFAVKFYTAGRQLRSRRQQHPGLLHPGRDQVPRSHSRGQTRAGSRISAGPNRA